MPEFLLEMYVSRTTPERVEADAVRARQVADVLRREGRPVELIRTTFVPQEETCFFVYEASSAEDVLEAARRAELTWDGLVEAVTRTSTPDREEETG